MGEDNKFFILADNGFPIVKLEGPMAKKYHDIILGFNPTHVSVNENSWNEAVVIWLMQGEEE